jgi:hypothetical protein
MIGSIYDSRPAKATGGIRDSKPRRANIARNAEPESIAAMIPMRPWHSTHSTPSMAYL